MQNNAKIWHEGYVAGQRSMDAEHYAVALRLRRLPLDGGSHENLSAIAGAIWHGDFGWTKDACSALRDKIIELLGGVHDKPVSVDAGRCSCGDDCDRRDWEPWRVSYDELGNERYKAIAELRKFEPMMGGKPTEEASKLIRCITGKSDSHVACCNDLEETRDRLIHLLGGDEPTLRETWDKWCEGREFPPNGDGSVGSLKSVEEAEALIREVRKRKGQCEPKSVNEDGDGGEVTITDELRECVHTATKQYDDTLWYEMGDDSEADHTICYITEGELLRVADGIDEWFKRLCEQQEAVLQKTIDGMVDYDDLYAAAASFAGCDECGEYKQCMYQEFEKRVAVEQERDELQAECDRLTAALDELHADPANDVICRLERERDELQKRLDEMREQRDHWASEATKVYRLFFPHDEYCVPNEPSEMVVHKINELQAKLDAIREALDG